MPTKSEEQWHREVSALLDKELRDWWNNFSLRQKVRNMRDRRSGKELEQSATAGEERGK